MSRDRNTNVSLYRVLLMYGICLLHCLSYVGGHPNLRLSYVFNFCVPGFVFISGWYGVNFSWKKLLSLWGTAFYCVAIVSCISYLFGGGIKLHLIKDFWFLNAYTILLCFSPLLNFALGVARSSKEAFKFWMPLLFLIFIWAFAVEIPRIGMYVPVSRGVEQYSGLTLIGVYVVAILIRIYNVEQHIRLRMLVLCSAICAYICSRGLGGYTSPFQLVVAGTCFLLFKKLTIPTRMSKCICWLEPSLFSVYLLHSHNDFGFPLIRQLQTLLLSKGLNINIVHIAVAMIIFFCGIVIDIPRRIMGKIVETKLETAQQ